MKLPNGLHLAPLAIAISSALLLHPNIALADTSNIGTTLDTVVVNGQDPNSASVGDTHKEKAPASKATLTKAQLEKFAALDSPVSGALKYMPGVHASGGDNSGVTEGGLNIRGFSQDQIGFTRDGVPLNDPQFLTPHADFFGDPENYQSVQVFYGGASINAPTLTASGGSVQIQSVAPTREAGVLLKQNVGSNNLLRTFARVNTGEYNGLSAWFSTSRTTADLWDDSDGELSSNRYEGNLQYEWGNGNRLNAIFSSFLMRSNSYKYPTLAEYRAGHYDSGYPQASYPTAGGTAGVADSTTPGSSAAASRADFKIQTYALNGLFNLSDNVQLKVNPYFVRVADGTAAASVVSVSEASTGSDLNGDGDTLDPSVTGALSVYPTQYRIGGSNTLDITLNDAHTLQLGLWTDYTHADNQMPVIQIKGNGKPASIDGSHPLRDGNGNTVYFTNQRNQITTQKLWLQDTWDIRPDLTLTAGLAWQHTRLEGDDRLSGFGDSADYHHVLPSLSLAYQLNAQQQLYYNTTSNMRVPAVASVYGRSDGSAKQKPEQTWNQEIGWRYTTDALLLNAALFYDRFKNRQAAYEAVSGVTSYLNAGDVTSRGLELALNGLLPGHFNYFGSWTWLRATQRDDYSAAGASQNTAGKQLYDSPRQLFTAGLGYDDQVFYANFLGRYTGSFYGDLANNERIGGYTVFDLNLGYRFKHWGGALKQTTVSLNLNNAFDKQYLAGVNSGAVSANPDDSAFYSAPKYYRGAPRSLVAGIAVEF
ncbi:TonB-dependent receptor family protein [Pseudomonas typographi]|uniref:TonB-dependent receptor n=1 Tax=Pseudomonas typographi TaxID=2715964 RepID=A0ABR7Z055_9PSED|nr:TonB-dependent receptor [Pseudomonas typographi]MBD1550593.1 TonB-dependent receptor [Pseudomonas typographi]MBD1598716.1 TonB-dependent receptor [Pseudomonas typographi]